MDKILAPIKKRILEIPDLKGVSKRSFFEKIKVSSSNFRTNGLRSEVGGDVIRRILIAYDDISSDWLILGQGNMLRESVTQEKKDDISSNTSEEENLLKIPKEITILKDRLIDSKSSAINALKASINAQTETIHVQKEIIQLLKERLESMEKQVDCYTQKQEKNI